MRASSPVRLTPGRVRREEKGYEHLRRAPIRRVGIGELLGHVALLDGRAVEEVDAGQNHGNQPQAAKRQSGADPRDEDARMDGVARRVN